MKSLFISLAAIALLATPAVASSVETGLSFSQVQQELGGFSCAGSACSKVTSFSVPLGEQVDLSQGTFGRCGKQVGFWSAPCVPHSLVSASKGGGSASHKVETTKVLGFDGQTGTFSITTTVTTK